MEGLKDNSIASVWEWFFISLKSHYNENELKAIRRILFEDFFSLREVDVTLQKEYLFTETQLVKLIKAINKLKKSIPVQYITGKTHFLDFILNVNPNVLIPRPETEELVLLAIDKIKESFGLDSKIKVLDIGCGSGCIAISLAHKFKNAIVYGIDNSRQAIEAAINNAKLIGVNIKFKRLDILENIDIPEKFDIIISNPPYVRQSEKQYMHKNVLDYEPAQALFVADEDPLIYYREICKKAVSGLLDKNGLVFFEINEGLSNEVKNLMKAEGINYVEIHNDFRDLPRFAYGKLSV